jgi:hypothetical protein
MKIPTQLTGLGTTGLSGIVLMTLHLTGHITGWAWPVLYIFLILAGIGQENRRQL